MNFIGCFLKGVGATVVLPVVIVAGWPRQP